MRRVSLRQRALSRRRRCMVSCRDDVTAMVVDTATAVCDVIGERHKFVVVQVYKYITSCWDFCTIKFQSTGKGTIFSIGAYEYVRLPHTPELLSRFVSFDQWSRRPQRYLTRVFFGPYWRVGKKQAFRYKGRLKPAKTIWRHMDEISFPT